MSERASEINDIHTSCRELVCWLALATDIATGTPTYYHYGLALIAVESSCARGHGSSIIARCIVAGSRLVRGLGDDVEQLVKGSAKCANQPLAYRGPRVLAASQQVGEVSRVDACTCG